ncbi:MAG TPA: hypothetical protein VFD73_28000, partial [Gemmatimonadales bacterium]|nr:hypothetical protein [Gemmatimonadales bacterium]
PAGLLRAGRGYRWTVRTLDRPGAVARGDAELIVLDEDAARRCEVVHDILEPEKPDSLPLLAEIDRSLGLLLEAREELQAALDSEPEDRALRAALAEIATQLENDDDPR